MSKSMLTFAQNYQPTVDIKRRAKWSDYKEPYLILIKKGLAPIQAAKELADFNGLNEAELTKLRNASRQWAYREKHKN